jgi:predicted nucleic acid-binding Zn ribbon protein
MEKEIKYLSEEEKKQKRNKRFMIYGASIIIFVFSLVYLYILGQEIHNI